MDEIRIENLEVYAYHGVYPEENKKGQSFFVNAILYTDTRAAGLEDDLALSTNYGEICQFIYQWMKEHTYQLLETVTETVARQILLHFPHVRELELEVRKPQAPIRLPFESVSVKIRRGWHRVYLSLGSNLGDRRAYLERAVEALKGNEDIRVTRVSDWIETKPYGNVEQGDFLNGVLEADTLLRPKELLEELHYLEQQAGRERLIHWGPRTLDLDILFYDNCTFESPELVIPHRDLQNREFVLKPMAQIAPYFRHPVLGKTVQELMEDLKS